MQKMSRRLTPEERLSFDIRGYVLLPEVLSPSELAALNARLDPIEQIGLRCREENPTALGVAPGHMTVTVLGAHQNTTQLIENVSIVNE